MFHLKHEFTMNPYFLDFERVKLFVIEYFTTISTSRTQAPFQEWLLIEHVCVKRSLALVM